MNHFNSLPNNRPQRRHGFSIRNLAIAAVIGICGAVGSAAINAQATAGSIFGKAPAGDTVSATGTTNGLHRHTKVDAKGRYNFGSLPIGVYTVTLEENGTPVVKHLDVKVIVGRGVAVNFDCTQGQCAQIAKP